MSKKHFIELADMMRDIKRVLADPNQGNTISPNVVATFIEDKLADFCRSQNPRFNRERWIDYINGECGPNGGRPGTHGKPRKGA